VLNFTLTPFIPILPLVSVGKNKGILMKLLGALASPFVARVLMFARIKGIDLPWEPAPGGLRSDEYRAITPISRIPALLVDDQCIAESEVICEFLEDRHPEPSGLPADPMGRATSRLISRITDFYVAPNTGPLFRQLNPAERDQEAVDATAADLANAFGYVEHFMGEGPFCAGAEPSLGDCALTPVVIFMQKALFPAFPSIVDPTQSDGRLSDWWQAVQHHEACKATIDEFSAAVDALLIAISKGKHS